MQVLFNQFFTYHILNWKEQYLKHNQQKVDGFRIGFLSDGTGITTPRAIEKMQKLSHTKIVQIDYNTTL